VAAPATNRNIRSKKKESGEDRPALDLTGVKLGSVHITRKIASGGMGDVWYGIEEDLGVPVAVKVLPARFAASQSAVRRFMREARSVAKLDHPNIVRVLQAGRRELNGEQLRVMVMEHVGGGDAHSAMHANPDRRLDATTAARIVLEAAHGLRHAHAAGIVHRDVKPANLLLTEMGRVKIADFGLSRVGAATDVVGHGDVESADMTSIGLAMGTPLYMSPEQGQGLEVDGRADVYSLGVTLYELLAGYPPFFGADGQAIVEKHIEEPFEYPEEDFASLPGVVVELIKGMCCKRPEERLSLSTVIERLEMYLGVSPLPETAVEEPNPALTRTNLTPRVTSFVGRSADVAELTTLFRDGARMVTVMGPGGVGKTRLAQEFGLIEVSKTGQYPGGVWFCDLTEARALHGIATGVARGIGFNLTSGDPVQQVHAALRMRGPMLVILDNFEQVADHAPSSLAVWMRGTPHVKFVVSSREPLHIEGERLFNLKPLEAGGPVKKKSGGTGPVPRSVLTATRPPSRTGSGVSAEPGPAVRLFVDRAQMANREFTLTEANRADVERICQELDGLPLAIELAAARTSGLTLPGILERLPKRLDLLASRRRDASARQTTMRSAIEWSWNLLTPWERLALAHCSVFVDGFLMEAAESVVDLSAFPGAPMVMDVVETLTEKSLVIAEPDATIPGETRYRMYESIRDFASRKMAEPDSVREPEGAVPHDLPFVPGGQTAQSLTGDQAAHQLRLRHARYYVGQARRTNIAAESRFNVEMLMRTMADLENLLTAQDSIEDTHPELSAEAIAEASMFLRVRGPWQDRVPRLRRGVARCGDNVLLRARLLGNLAQALFDSGIPDDTLAAAIESAEYSRQLVARDPKDIAFQRAMCRALSAMGLARSRIGPQEEALKFYAEAEEIGIACRDIVGTSIAVSRRGQIQANRGDFDAAKASFLKAADLARSIGNLYALSPSLGNYGMVHAEVGEYETAITILAEAEAIDRSLNNMIGVSAWVGGRGNALHGLGKLEEAMECLSEAAQIAREFGARMLVPTWVGNQGLVLSKLGRYDEALVCFREAEEIARETGNQRGIGFALFGRAKALVLLSDSLPAEARDRPMLLEAHTAIRECRTIRETNGVASNPNFFSTLGMFALTHARLLAHQQTPIEDLPGLAQQIGDAVVLGDDMIAKHGFGRNHKDGDLASAVGWLDEAKATLADYLAQASKV